MVLLPFILRACQSRNCSLLSDAVFGCCCQWWRPTSSTIQDRAGPLHQYIQLLPVLVRAVCSPADDSIVEFLRLPQNYRKSLAEVYNFQRASDSSEGGGSFALFCTKNQCCVTSPVYAHCFNVQAPGIHWNMGYRPSLVVNYHFLSIYGV